MITTLLKNLDIFGQSVQFTFRRQSKYKSEIGGSASIIFYTVLIILIVLQTMEFTDMKEAQTLISNVILQEDEFYD